MLHSKIIKQYDGLATPDSIQLLQHPHSGVQNEVVGQNSQHPIDFEPIASSHSRRQILRLQISLTPQWKFSQSQVLQCGGQQYVIEGIGGAAADFQCCEFATRYCLVDGPAHLRTKNRIASFRQQYGQHLFLMLYKGCQIACNWQLCSGNWCSHTQS